MAANLTNMTPRLADRKLFLVAAIGFPLFVLIGYFRTYYGSALFNSPPLPSTIVHVHGVVMTLWVIYFSVQIALIRTKNVKLHMTMGMVGVALAVLVVVTGTATAYDASLVRASAPPGWDAKAFFLVPMFDMVQFVVLFGAAIYFRKRPAEHKSLMLLTALNFLPAALFRLPILPPEQGMIQAFGGASVIAIGCLMWHSVKHRKVNGVFAAGVVAMIVSVPLRIAIGETQAWQEMATLLAP